MNISQYNQKTIAKCHKAYTKKLLVSGREAPENLTRSVGLFFYFGLFFILCRP